MNILLEPQLLKFAFLTIVMEIPLFYAAGYRKPIYLLAYAMANFISNVLLNQSLPPYEPAFSYWLQLALGEVLVVLLEFQLMTYVVREDRESLFKTVVLTNVLTLFYGLFGYYIDL